APDPGLLPRPPRSWTAADLRRTGQGAMGEDHGLPQRCLAVPSPARTLPSAGQAVPGRGLRRPARAAAALRARATPGGALPRGVGGHGLLLRGAASRDRGGLLAIQRDRCALGVVLGGA